MKKFASIMLATSLLFSTQSHAEGWLDSLKSLFGMGEDVQEVKPNVTDMVSQISEKLGVNTGQARGGLGAIFNYAKDNLSSEQFGQLSETLPGLGDLLKAAPDVSKMSSEGGLGGLLDKAAEYNESLKAINDVKKQFEALGLKPEMIMQYVEQAKAYLDTEQGQQAKQLLMQGVGKLLG